MTETYYFVQFLHNFSLAKSFVYGDTPEEAWNKALIFLITERLKS